MELQIVRVARGAFAYFQWCICVVLWAHFYELQIILHRLLTLKITQLTEKFVLLV